MSLSIAFIMRWWGLTGVENLLQCVCSTDAESLSRFVALLEDGGDEEKISLSYQEEFVIDGKTIRPDFIIRTDAGTWIADAKFRTHSTNTELMNLCWELAHNKKYNLNSEVPVYLFHCANHAGDDSYKSIFKNSWLPYCNYGSYFNKLQRGHILLTPQSNMKERSIDNLIR